MITLVLTNKHVVIRDASRPIMRALNAVTSYKVEGARFSRAYKDGFWDGRENLLTTSTKLGLHAPIGLAEDLAEALTAGEHAFRVEDRRVVKGKRRALPWNRELDSRPYQKQAIQAVLGPDKRERLLYGSGLLKMPIRSGKTHTAAKYIHALGLRTLMIVPSQMLLHQTVESLSLRLKGERIGVIGDGYADVRFVTVATMQSLVRWKKNKDDPKWRDIVESTDVLIIDEAHRLRGDVGLKDVVMSIPARFRLALSATPYLDSEVEQGRGIIWLKACIGPKRIDVSESKLIREGFLMTQNIRMLRVTKPEKFADWKWSVDLQRKAIWNNAVRNHRVAAEARKFVDQNKRTLIITTRVEHTKVLSELFWDQSINHEVITGSKKRGGRDEIMDDFTTGSLRCVIGTVLGEGVDIPEAEVVIVAAGGRDAKATMQRMRNMTVSEGKDSATLVDFMDEFNPYLKRHSNERLNVYKSVPEFNVEIVD